MIELIILPLITAVILSVMTGVLGCFIVWRKMAYFGDTVSHAALLGVALGVLLDTNHHISVLGLCVSIAFTISHFQSKNLAVDTTLGIIAHGSLALGLLVMATIQDTRINLQAVLMGDLLTLTITDLVYIAVLCAIAFALLIKYWKRLVLTSIDEDIAEVEGYNPRQSRFILTIIISTTIALGVKLVGALLISGMLILPAAAARRLSSSPEAMAINAAMIGVCSSIVGLCLSAFYDLPVGPLIICMSLVVYTIGSIVPKK